MDYILTTTLVSGSDTATVNSKKLSVGLNCYNALLPMRTKILTILGTTSIKLTNNALDDYTGNIIYTDLSPVRYAEKKCALKDVQSIVYCNGQNVDYILRDETEVERDSYNSIKNQHQDVKITLKAFPITFSPSKEYLEKIGLREDCSITIHTAMQDWIDEGYDYEDIETIRSTVKLNGISYKISEKTLTDFIGNNGCYIVFGLKL